MVEISDDNEKRLYSVSTDRQLNFYNGESVRLGDIIVEGVIDPADVLEVFGVEKTASFIIDEVQKIYRRQGVEINDKHLEVIVSKMLSMVEITDPGETNFTKGEIVKEKSFLSTNKTTDGRKAKAKSILVGLAEAAKRSESWISAASFERTQSVLALAAIKRKKDMLEGMKENVIVGNPIPAGTGHKRYRNTVIVSRKRSQSL